MYRYFVLQVEHISCNHGWGTNFINDFFVQDDISHTKLSKKGPHCSESTSRNFADFSGAPRPIELRVPQLTYLQSRKNFPVLRVLLLQTSAFCQKFQHQQNSKKGHFFLLAKIFASKSYTIKKSYSVLVTVLATVCDNNVTFDQNSFSGSTSHQLFDHSALICNL